jgi:hypothetical protein
LDSGIDGSSFDSQAFAIHCNLFVTYDRFCASELDSNGATEFIYFSISMGTVRKIFEGGFHVQY